jgi:alpha-1,3/alpha-1,6-mannosyltransferase
VDDPPILVSINRFERKKNLQLAIDAFAEMRTRAETGSGASRARLVMAGGYDPRLAENVEHFAELERSAAEYGLRTVTASTGYSDAVREPDVDVVFVRSFSDADKVKMLADASLVVYTPRGEHFGIVPLEAMGAWRPVLAVDDAGPRETVLHEQTGFLETDTANGFAPRMLQAANDASLVAKLGRDARKHVSDTFTLGAMRRQLNAHVTALVTTPPARALSFPLLAALAAVSVGYCLMAGVPLE